MDDSDDDARYPPNPHPTKPRHYFSSYSAARSKAPFHSSHPLPHVARRYADDDEEDEEEEEEEQNDMDQPMDDEEEQEEDDDEGGGHHRHYGDDDDDSSSESRGKRRKIDKPALGFEFAPRLPPQAAAAPSKLLSRTSPLDWSEDSTFALLHAWGDRYLQNGRKSLRSDEWNEVAKIVSQASKVNRSDLQCRNQVDMLKKNYKKEKASMAERGNAGSNWVYFKKMDALMSSPSLPPQAVRQQLQQRLPPPRLPCGVDAGEYVFASSSVYRNGHSGNDEMRDSPGDSGTEDEGDVDDDSDGPPPKREYASGSSDSSFKILAESIHKFGEIYEKMENHKRQQMAELERMRKEFQRDLEVQKRQILERVQAEIAKLREDQGVEDIDEEEREDREEDDNDGDDGGSAENLSGFVSASFYLTAFV